VFLAAFGGQAVVWACSEVEGRIGMETAAEKHLHVAE